MQALKQVFLSFISTILVFCICNAALAQSREEEEFSVMSLNIRYDNPEDKPHDWLSRRDSLARFLLHYKPHILGTQEVLHNQIEDLAQRLPQYSYVGVGRLDGKEAGEYAAIWYQQARMQLISSGNFWLSPTPEVAGSVGWDAACERILTWAKLRDQVTGDTLLVANTHLDHIGQRARAESVRLIKERIARLKGMHPLILMGDLNMTREDTNYQALVSSPDTYWQRPEGKTAEELQLYDTRSLMVDGDIFSLPFKAGTFHNFGRIPQTERPCIDYIFITKELAVLFQQHISTEGKPYCLSDHDAVLAHIMRKP